jgi:hypothetical protein
MVLGLLVDVGLYAVKRLVHAGRHVCMRARLQTVSMHACNHDK